MADKIRKATDKELVKLERKISGVYRQSQKEIKERWTAYMEQSAVKINQYEKAYDAAVISQDAKEIKKAKKALKNAKLEQTLYNDRYKEMVGSITDKLYDANKIALAYANGKMFKIYAMNHNAIAPTANSLGISFTIVNEKTVRNLVKSGDIKLPYKKLNKIKDARWNTKKLNSAVLQGIIQGDSMDRIAERILPIVHNNESAAIRNARTMVTGAENQGRLDSFQELQDMGTVIKKKWIATLDDRVREWHADMNGDEVDLDESFVDGNGNELQYPGDPDAEPETVYNCRCAMEAVIIGFKDENGKTNYL